jgi:hypothetical protein
MGAERRWNRRLPLAHRREWAARELNFPTVGFRRYGPEVLFWEITNAVGQRSRTESLTICFVVELRFNRNGEACRPMALSPRA